ncbi:hypothetical protein AG1IA_08459 [Rhizoctonia solani AG-1 IA]|uniref:Uncharacterized protein n=1 Tax=Thanatephorus cucumeris (strain AG1-IA) TaxID=983506 RepID=L8WHT6_THACA|nr:hypothetical protein AG1IA_08459 [Rhizoctonia solani AG-1 IA]
MHQSFSCNLIIITFFIRTLFDIVINSVLVFVRPVCIGVVGRAHTRDQKITMLIHLLNYMLEPELRSILAVIEPPRYQLITP